MGPSGLELSRQPGGVAHTRPWKGGLWYCAKYSFLWRQGGRTEAREAGRTRGGEASAAMCRVGRMQGMDGGSPSTEIWSPVGDWGLEAKAHCMGLLKALSYMSVSPPVA